MPQGFQCPVTMNHHVLKHCYVRQTLLFWDSVDSANLRQGAKQYGTIEIQTNSFQRCNVTLTT